MILNKLRKIILNPSSTISDIVQAVNQIQDTWLATLNVLLAVPFLGGNAIKGVSLDRSKDNSINTGLGYKYSGWFITRTSGATSLIGVYESPTINNSPDRILILNCSDNITVDLWVF